MRYLIITNRTRTYMKGSHAHGIHRRLIYSTISLLYLQDDHLQSIILDVETGKQRSWHLNASDWHDRATDFVILRNCDVHASTSLLLLHW